MIEVLNPIKTAMKMDMPASTICGISELIIVSVINFVLTCSLRESDAPISVVVVSSNSRRLL
jgi:hypothetical protein